MTIFCFPDPYPDELFFSICARYSQRIGFPSYKLAVSQMFGETIRRVNIFFPNRIENLVERTFPVNGISSDEFITNHTILPFYSIFIPTHKSAKIRSDMKTKSGNSAFSIGSFSRIYQHQKFIRFCPKCVENDRFTYGETFWHRLHQIPEVTHCPVHEIPLRTSSVLSRHYNSLVTAEEAIHDSLEEENDTGSNAQIEISQSVEFILNNYGSLMKLQPLLSDLTFGKKKTFIEQGINGKVPDVSPGASRPIYNLIAFASLNYVSFEQFSAQLISESDLNQLFLISNIVSNAMGEATENIKPDNARKHTHQEKLSQYRDRWLEIRRQNPGANRSSLQKQFSGVFDWLRSHDKKWVYEHMPSLDCDQSDPQKRPDYFRWIAKLIHETALIIKNLPAPRRVSIQYVEELLGYKGKLTRLRHIPVIAQALEENIETVEIFQFRKIQWALDTFTGENITPTRLQIIKRAGIEKSQHKPAIQTRLEQIIASQEKEIFQPRW